MDKMCSVPGCGNKVIARDLCYKHYQQLRRTGQIDFTVKSGVCKEKGCTKPVHAKGYCMYHYNHLARPKSKK